MLFTREDSATSFPTGNCLHILTSVATNGLPNIPANPFQNLPNILVPNLLNIPASLSNLPNPDLTGVPNLTDIATTGFHTFAEYLYGNNMVEQQNWEPGRYFLSSLNFGGLEDVSSFEVTYHNTSCHVNKCLRTYFSIIRLLE